MNVVVSGVRYLAAWASLVLLVVRRVMVQWSCISLLSPIARQSDVCFKQHTRAAFNVYFCCGEVQPQSATTMKPNYKIPAA